MANGSNSPVVALEVVAGPLDGLRYEGRQERTLLGRSDGAAPDKTRNHLVLQRDSYASSFHAAIYNESGKWWLIDLGSTNGTWLGRKKLEHQKQVELHEGELFVVGNSVIRFTTTPSGLPIVDAAAATRLSQASQTVMNRARNAAKDKDAPWVGASSLFAAIAETDMAPIPEFFVELGLTPDQAIELVNGWKRWQGDLAWIENDVLRGKKYNERMMRSILPTPRLQLIITLAGRAADSAGIGQIEPIHMLLGVFEEPGNRVALAFEDAGRPRATLEGLVQKVIKRHFAPVTPMPAESTISIPQMKAGLGPPAAPPRKPVDAETWLLARTLMDRLQTLQSEFHLAEPAVRLEALCSALREGLSQAPPAKRGPAIEVLHELFPVLADALLPPAVRPTAPSETTPPAIDPAKVNQTIDETSMKREEAKREARKSSGESMMDTGRLMQQVFGGDRKSPNNTPAPGGANGAGPFVDLTQHLYRFALDMEQLAKSLVQTLHGGGGGESRYFLPFTVQDLRMMINKLLEGSQEEAVMEIRDYLYDLGHWIVALIAAHQKASSQWNADLWERISPKAITNEAKTRGGMLATSKANLWATYEVIARDLRPEVIEDQLSEKIGRLATEEFRKLSAHH